MAKKQSLDMQEALLYGRMAQGFRDYLDANIRASTSLHVASQSTGWTLTPAQREENRARREQGEKDRVGATERFYTAGRELGDRRVLDKAQDFPTLGTRMRRKEVEVEDEYGTYTKVVREPQHVKVKDVESFPAQMRRAFLHLEDRVGEDKRDHERSRMREERAAEHAARGYVPGYEMDLADYMPEASTRANKKWFSLDKQKASLKNWDDLTLKLESDLENLDIHPDDWEGIRGHYESLGDVDTESGELLLAHAFQKGWDRRHLQDPEAEEEISQVPLKGKAFEKKKKEPEKPPEKEPEEPPEKPPEKEVKADVFGKGGFRYYKTASGVKVRLLEAKQHAIKTGKRGGLYWLTATGEKVYVKKLVERA